MHGKSCYRGPSSRTRRYVGLHGAPSNRPRIGWRRRGGGEGGDLARLRGLPPPPRPFLSTPRPSTSPGPGPGTRAAPARLLRGHPPLRVCFSAAGSDPCSQRLADLKRLRVGPDANSRPRPRPSADTALAQRWPGAGSALMLGLRILKGSGADEPKPPAPAIPPPASTFSPRSPPTPSYPGVLGARTPRGSRRPKRY